MSVPQITTSMTPPDPGAGRAAFVAAANQFGNSMNPYASEANVVATFVNGRAVDTDASATAAGLAKTAAEAARDAAIDAATAIASDYSTAGHAYAKNDLVWDEPGKLYRCILAYTSTATRPAADPAHWVRVNTTPDDVTAIVSAAVNGLLDVPVTTKAAAYTLALGDRGRCISTNSQVSIPANASVAFPVGTTILVRNTSGSAINLLITTDTLRKNGTTQTGTRSIPAYGTATLHKDSATVWYVSGAN